MKRKALCLWLAMLAMCCTQTASAQLPDWLNFSANEDATPITPPPDSDWTLRISALFLQRTDNGSNNEIFSDQGGNTLLDTDDLDLGHGHGWDVSLFGPINEDNAFEVRYFRLDAFHFNTALPQVFDIEESDISYSAEVQNGELNGRYRVNDDFILIYGIRHIQHDETLDSFIFLEGEGDATFEDKIEAENFLTGLQIGADLRLWECGCFRLENLWKVGLYHNHVKTQATSRTTFFGDGEFVILDQADDHRDVLSFVGEFQLAAVFQITDSIEFRTGYQLLALTNIATAPNQVADSYPNGAVSTQANATDSPIYHGLMLQLEFTLP